MADTTNTFRNTTISLDEYNKLQNEVNTLREAKGALQTNIYNLNEQISKLSEKQPLVKVIHLNKEWESHYDDWADDMVEDTYLRQSKVEFINLHDVTTLAKKEAKLEISENINTLEQQIDNNKTIIKSLEADIDSLEEKLRKKQKLIDKLDTAHSENLEEEKERYENNLTLLKKSQQKDVDSYNETITELKEELQKVKDNKTDVEVEKKRNEEIKNLKGRINDLETMLKELSSMNFFKRVWKVRKLSNEAIAVHETLIERKNAADKVGTTWVKENNKYRPYDAFNRAWKSIQQATKSHYDDTIAQYFYTGTRF